MTVHVVSRFICFRIWDSVREFLLIWVAVERCTCKPAEPCICMHVLLEGLLSAMASTGIAWLTVPLHTMKPICYPDNEASIADPTNSS